MAKDEKVSAEAVVQLNTSQTSNRVPCTAEALPYAVNPNKNSPQ